MRVMHDLHICHFNVNYFDELIGEPLLRNSEIFLVAFCFNSLCPNQHFFSHVGIGFPGLNQY